MKPPHPGVLISSVMATGNRAEFVKQALRNWSKQTYPWRELIVVDDGREPVASLCRSMPGVRYVRLKTPTLLGAKLNLGFEKARGEIFHKLDDDDYYAPRFLETAVEALARSSRNSIVAWDSFLVLLAGELRPRYSGTGWAAGGTLTFRRRVWERRRFREVARSVDRLFLADHRNRVVPVADSELYMLVRHGANTWTTMDDVTTDDWMRTQPTYPKRIGLLMDREDAEFYKRLKPSGPIASIRD